ncbi:uncharacterized protein N7511_002993 [Penicillium nucicola]|uniref:uncharacterized protein n=1 Tax=Penicillium nucicola TaxID=1850975 RepID=UPI0025457B8F|nr:uncharacterized protein N7511_002993 [Penicillium nucicola]KAJ5770942.1 hypothetical protein N7511_002993 [Penicillium nucicola]
MSRHSHFQSGREPLQDQSDLELRRSHVSGPVHFLNPTWAHYTVTRQPQTKAPAPGEAQPHPPIEHLWRSRDNRKGRHALRVDTKAIPQETGYTAPPVTHSTSAISKGILRMLTSVPYWDVSYLVAITFTIGSMIWIINAFFVWLPLEDPQTTFSGETLTGGGVSAFIGATVFEIGSVLLLLEAINANQTGCFGWALESVLSKTTSEEDEGHAHTPASTKIMPTIQECRHHHANRRSLFFAKHAHPSDSRHEDLADYPGYVTSSPDGRSFRWVPSLSELRSHYFHELGFLASLIQFLAASIFWIAGLTGLPGIYNHMSQGVADGVYWVPQIVGGMGFILSGLLFTLETQSKWYRPAWHVLGWHIGVWNFIGGIGFTLCGALGPASMHSGVEYQATLATFWGSWAFMIGSTIQWYESLQKHPVERK